MQDAGLMAGKNDRSPYAPALRVFGRRFIARSLLLTWLLSCGGSEPIAFPITVISLTDSDQPLPGVQIEVDGRIAGKTDRSGLLHITVRRLEGAEIRLAATCPQGFRRTKQIRRLALRGFDRLDGNERAAGPEVVWQCRPAERLAALVVRSVGRPGLPVMVGGREVARTGPQGTAHALLKLPPGSSLTVTLDTADRPGLIPRNPQRVFRLEDRDALLIFDQRFSEKRAYRKRKRGSATSPAHVPYRIR